MESIRNSYTYALLTALSGWFSRQWETSFLIGWLTGQDLDLSGNSLWSRWIGCIRRLYCRVFEKLHLSKLLQDSVFLHPILFVAAAVVLAPLLPTMVILALVCASFFSLFLRLGADRKASIASCPINCYVALFAVIYLYATLTSTTFSGSLFPGLLTIAFVLFFFAVSSCGLERKRLEWMLWGLMFAGVAVSLYGFYQFLFRNININFRSF